MSLINQVLKDLEQRHAREMAEATQNMEGLALASPVRETSGRIPFRLIITGLLLVTGIAASWGWWHYTRRGLQPVATASTLPVEQVQAPLQSIRKKMPPAQKHITVRQTAVAEAEDISSHSNQGVRKHVRTSHSFRKVSIEPQTSSQSPKDDGQMQKQMVPLQLDQKAEIEYQAGYDQIELHNLSRAEHLLRRALSYDPGHIRARELLAGLMIKQGRWVETAGLMQQGLKQRPDNTTFVKLDARVLMQLNRDSDAIAVLREHAPGMAADPDYYALLAALYQRQKDHRDAAKIYARILRLRPDAGIWWVGLGISLEAMGKTKKAQEAYAHASKTGTLAGNLAQFTNNRLLALDAINYPMH